jgi:23S rRNA (uracil1939-C5)-methyltransferase
MDRLPALLAEAVAATSISDRVPQAEIAAGDDAAALVLRVLEAPNARDLETFAELGRRLGIDVYLQTGGPDTIAPLTASPRTLAYTLEPDGIRIEFAPGDFIQINAEINQAMVAAALAAAEIGPGDRVLDLYSGIGNFSLPIARRAAHVLGVEGAGALVARAARNAEHNGIANARFVTADLDESDWPFFRGAWDLLFLDPARNGAASAVAAVDVMRPRRIVYVSCHPGTLARDAGILVHEYGYRLEGAGVMDMFPHTAHVESVALFERGGRS